MSLPGLLSSLDLLSSESCPDEAHFLTEPLETRKGLVSKGLETSYLSEGIPRPRPKPLPRVRRSRVHPDRPHPTSRVYSGVPPSH